MNPDLTQAVIGSVCLAGLLLFVGRKHIREVLDDFAWRRDEERARELIERERIRAGYRPLAAQINALAEHLNEQVAAARCGWFAETARQIAELDEIWGIEDVRDGETA